MHLAVFLVLALLQLTMPAKPRRRTYRTTYRRPARRRY